MCDRTCVVVNASDSTQSHNSGSILGRGSPANEAVHPTGVDKFVAVSKQLGEQTTSRRFPAATLAVALCD